jgi:hypothetical protein
MRESKGIMEVKRIAYKVLEENSKERKEAEKMMGCSLEEMTDDQKKIMLACMTAFQGKY